MTKKEELTLLNAAVDGYAKALKKRLAGKLKEGYKGWQGAYSQQNLCVEIIDDAVSVWKHGVDRELELKNATDIGCRGMMLWYRQSRFLKWKTKLLRRGDCLCSLKPS